MSTTVLQRVVVRMLFDPTFRDRVYADPLTTLQDINLTPAERQWVVTPDPRAYGTDAYRSSRALTGLLEEYPVAGALAVRCPDGLTRLHAFFASSWFHRCVQERGSMAAAFGGYLRADAFAMHPDVACMAAIEQAITHVRRAPDIPVDPSRALTDNTPLHLAPWVALLDTHPTTLPRYGTILGHLQQRGPELLQAVLDTAWHLPGSPRQRHDTASEFVLIVGTPGTDGPSLEATSDALGTLLANARIAVPLATLCQVAVQCGAEAHEAREIIEDLMADRLLIHSS